MSEIILYTTPDGVAKVEVAYEGDTFWLTQRQLADLFGVDVRTISEHLTNIFDSGELDRGATIRKFRKVQIEGGREVTRDLDHFSLDAIITDGFKIESERAVLAKLLAQNEFEMHRLFQSDVHRFPEAQVAGGEE